MAQSKALTSLSNDWEGVLTLLTVQCYLFNAIRDQVIHYVGTTCIDTTPDENDQNSDLQQSFNID